MEPIEATIRLIFAVIALVFFALAGLAIPAPPRIQWLGWGLFFLTLAFFLIIRA